ncbi:MAG: hypothetical protein JSW39_08820 [Desulfobacterales bacterium]|nr:MAG: hypothetical protein JSW39_08820 [Desulfobacterales bacterium]
MESAAISKLARDLTIGLIFVTSLVAAVLVTMHYWCYSISAQRRLNARMSDTYNLAKVMVIPLWNSDTNMARQIAEAYLTCEYIAGIRVETEYGKILYDNLPAGENKSIIREERVRQGDHYFGRLILQFSREGIERTLKKTVVTISVLMLPVMALIIIGSHCMLRYLLNKALKAPDRGA